MVLSKQNYLYGFLFTFFIPISISLAQEVRWDYSFRPEFSIDIISLELDVQLGKAPWNIKGSVIYRIRPKISNVLSIRLDAGNMNISYVRLNDQFLYIKQQADSLYITLPPGLKKNHIYDLSISYSSSLHYGVIETRNGTLASSSFPYTVHYWIPGLDHPTVEMPVKMTWTIPSDMSFLVAGHLVKKTPLSDQTIRLHFETQSAIPFSSLWFIVGENINIQTVESQGQHMQWVIPQQLEVSPLFLQDKITSALENIKYIEQKTKKKLPYFPLTIALFEDSYGELYNYSAGLIRLYSTIKSDDWDDFTDGIAAQWAGVYIRSQQWKDQNEIDRLRYLLSFPLPGEIVSNYRDPYHFSHIPYPNGVSPSMLDSLVFKESSLLFDSSLALESGEIDKLFYTKTGIPTKWFSTPSSLLSPKIAQYHADIRYQINKGRLRVIIKKIKNSSPYGNKIAIRLVAQRRSYPYQVSQSIILKGEEKDITMHVGNSLESFYILYDNSMTNIVENKDISLWLYQLKAPDKSARLASAKKLNSISPPLDAQLILIDALRQEPSPLIRSEIYGVLSVWLQARSGTESIFLEGLRDKSIEVKLVVLESLMKYKPKENIKDGIENWLNRYDGSIKGHFLFKPALDIYVRNSSRQELFNILERNAYRWHSIIQWYVLENIDLDIKDSQLESWFNRLSGAKEETYIRVQAIQRWGFYAQNHPLSLPTDNQLMLWFGGRNGLIRRASVQFCQSVQSVLCIRLLKHQKKVEADPRIKVILSQ